MHSTIKFIQNENIKYETEWNKLYTSLRYVNGLERDNNDNNGIPTMEQNVWYHSTHK